MDYERYAIWWVPRPGTGLAQFGAEWTGWCADEGVVSSDPAVAASAVRGRAAPAALVRRGLHAGLSAPFRLAPGRSRWALEDALAELAERSRPLLLPRLEVAIVEGRVALALARPDHAVAALVDGVAEAVRPFALPCAAEGSAGRGAAADRLHLPLTDRIELATAFALVAELDRRLAPVLARRQSIADLALAGDPGGGRPWRLLQRHPLAGEQGARKDARMPAGMAWRGPNLLAPLAGAAGGATTA